MGRNSDQNQQKRDDQRNLILSNSLDLFVRRGIGSTRVSDIVKSCEISQGLFYHYFPSKDAVLTQLLSDALPRMDEAARGLEQLNIPAKAKITLALEQLFTGIQSNEDTAKYHLLIAMASVSEALPEEAKAIIFTHAKNPYDILARIFATGQREGDIKTDDPNQQAMLFWVIVKGFAIHHAVHSSSLGTPDLGMVLPLFLK